MIARATARASTSSRAPRDLAGESVGRPRRRLPAGARASVRRPRPPAASARAVEPPVVRRPPGGEQEDRVVRARVAVDGELVPGARDDRAQDRLSVAGRRCASVSTHGQHRRHPRVDHAHALGDPGRPCGPPNAAPGARRGRSPTWAANRSCRSLGDGRKAVVRGRRPSARVRAIGGRSRSTGSRGADHPGATWRGCGGARPRSAPARTAASSSWSRSPTGPGGGVRAAAGGEHRGDRPSRVPAGALGDGAPRGIRRHGDRRRRAPGWCVNVGGHRGRLDPSTAIDRQVGPAGRLDARPSRPPAPEAARGSARRSAAARRGQSAPATSRRRPRHGASGQLLRPPSPAARRRR